MEADATKKRCSGTDHLASIPSADMSELTAIPSITLRDYFAGQALAGMLAHPETELDSTNLVPYMVQVFELADAMLVARERTAKDAKQPK
jgi:hypothetical protein